MLGQKCSLCVFLSFVCDPLGFCDSMANLLHLLLCVAFAKLLPRRKFIFFTAKSGLARASASASVCSVCLCMRPRPRRCFSGCLCLGGGLAAVCSGQQASVWQLNECGPAAALCAGEHTNKCGLTLWPSSALLAHGPWHKSARGGR